MDADKINEGIDDIYDASEEQLEKFLVGYVLAHFGIVGGVLSVVLKPIIRKVIGLTVFKLTDYIKRKGQKQIDIIEGKLIIREVNQAVEDKDEEAYIVAIGKY